nr:MAG TPA: hypothetical protein [Caudoviricetes sp.]
MSLLVYLGLLLIEDSLSKIRKISKKSLTRSGRTNMVISITGIQLLEKL